MLDLAEPERSIIKLTKREREEFEECEREIGETISEFLRCGRALSLIRSKRLYRETHATFDQYVVERWGLGIGAADTLLTSYHIAEQLEEAGINLPAQVTQSAMRSLSKVSPVEGLRAATWRYAVSISPGAECPPLSLLRRISGIIRDALDGGDNFDGAGNRIEEEEEEKSEDPSEGWPLRNGARRKRMPARDERFLRAAVRMATYPGFSLPAITSQVRSPAMARHVYEVCERLKVRIDQIEAAILRTYPDAQTQRA
jgi:hypothetical protein